MTKQRLMRRLFNCRVLTLLALLGLVVSPAMKGKTFKWIALFLLILVIMLWFSYGTVLAGMGWSG